MPRLIGFLAFLAIAGATAFAPPVTACAQPCPDDERGTCPPACDSCACCGHAMRPALSGGATASAAPPATRHAAATLDDHRPGVPDPRDIFHVPKPPVA